MSVKSLTDLDEHDRAGEINDEGVHTVQIYHIELDDSSIQSAYVGEPGDELTTDYPTYVITDDFDVYLVEQLNPDTAELISKVNVEEFESFDEAYERVVEAVERTKY